LYNAQPDVNLDWKEKSDELDSYHNFTILTTNHSSTGCFSDFASLARIFIFHNHVIRTSREHASKVCVVNANK